MILCKWQFAAFIYAVFSAALPADDKAENCQCFSCDTRDPSTNEGVAQAQLYTKATADGIGSVTTHAINAMAIASKLGWGYKGAYGSYTGKALRKHVAQEKVAMDFLFGNFSQVRPLHPASNGLVLNLEQVGRPWKDTKHLLTKHVLRDWADSLPNSEHNIYIMNDFNYDAVRSQRTT